MLNKKFVINNDTEINFYYDETSGVWGDGTHETTLGCLKLLKEAGCKNKAVLDIGTGTGIQSLYASKLGARDILSVDINPGAFGYLITNFQENNEQLPKMKLVEYDGDITYGADIIIMNMPPMEVKTYLFRIRSLMNKDCKIITVFPDRWNLENEIKITKCGLKIVKEIEGQNYNTFLLEAE